jgi:hypothetical protein
VSLAPSYACFGCVDFANNQRTRTYIEWACRTGKFTGDPSALVRRSRSWCECPDDAIIMSTDEIIVRTFQQGSPTVGERQDLLIPDDASGTFTISDGENVSLPITIVGITPASIQAAIAAWVPNPVVASITVDDYIAFSFTWLPAAGDRRRMTIDDSGVSYVPAPQPIVWDNPIDDGVCWYDYSVPESADFLGVVIVGTANIRSSTFRRELADAVNGGSVLGLPEKPGKQIVLEVELYATSQAGMNYGIQWLSRQFEGDQRCPSDGSTCASCQGQLVTFRVHCPTEDSLDNGLHSWAAGGTIDGFKLGEDDFPLGRLNCEKAIRGTLTIGTESFDSYSTLPVSSLEVEVGDSFTALGNCIIGPALTLDDVCCPICSIGCDPCTTDPGCDCLPPFILEPEVVGSVAPCFSDPVCRCVGAAAVTDLPAGYDSALRMTFRSGWDPSNPIFQRYGMRNAVFRVFENPDGFPVPTDLESYEALVDRMIPCAEVGVSWMPAGSELIVDGLSGKTWLKCNGKCVDHSSRVFTISGSIFPLKARCTDLIITVEWDCLNTQGNDAPGTILSSFQIETFLGFRL